MTLLSWLTLYLCTNQCISGQVSYNDLMMRIAVMCDDDVRDENDGDKENRDKD